MEKPVIKVFTMSKKDQKKHLRKHLTNKKYQVTIEILGKKKYAYCDDLSELDDFIKMFKAKIIKVENIHGKTRRN